MKKTLPHSHFSPLVMDRSTEGEVAVYSILPGPTKLERVGELSEERTQKKNIIPQALKEDFFKNVRPTSVIQLFPKPEEVANPVVYSLSPLTSAIQAML